jgi:nucleotide-binding universal stress UspA family protein
MAERILIPLDGSRLGEAALSYVEQMVAKLKPEDAPTIILLHIIAPPTHKIPGEGGLEEVFDINPDFKPAITSATAYLEGVGQGLTKVGAIVENKVVTGKAGVSSALSIIKAEEETKADLVAMSTHGRRGLSRWAYGSVTEKVLSGGKVPVLMVRAKE